MFRRGLRWFGCPAVLALLLAAAGCGKGKDVDPVVVPNPQDQQGEPKNKRQLAEPATRGPLTGAPDAKPGETIDKK
jgi:hypothetical protein